MVDQSVPRSSRGRFDALDGLRAVAVALVFLTHAFPNVFPGGFLGVTLFFALSGYLITTLLLSEHRRTGRISLKRFYVRRFLRLMPALFAMVLLTAAASIVVGTKETLRDAAPAITYTMDIVAPITHRDGGIYNATWSLAVEEQFYLVWPAIMIIGLRRRWNLRAIVFGFMAVCLAITAALTIHTGGTVLSDVYRLPTTHLPIMGAGILFAFARHDGVSERLRRVLASPAVPVVTLGVLAGALFGIDNRNIGLYRGGWLVFAILAAALVAHLVVAPTAGTARALSTSPFVWLGQRSYGFYLWQGPVILLLRDKLPHSTAVTAFGGLIVTLIATQASWMIVEQPFLRLKSRFESPHDPIVSGASETPEPTPMPTPTPAAVPAEQGEPVH